ncbi:MAG: hypothetical protein Q9163_002299 [Psora crenata]
MPPTSLARPLCGCMKELGRNRNALFPLKRTFASTRARKDEASLQTTASESPPPMPLDPNTVSTRREERLLLYQKRMHPIGSRRRRAAIQSSDNVPFEQMPYQCFQEARKVLAEDREEKLAQIAQMRKRISHWQSKPAAEQGGDAAKKGRLVRMQKYLEELKILADVNDPVIKKRFEDGMGDMNRPIYRYLADKKWRQYNRLLLMQRVSQYHIVPDLLPHLDPTASVSLGFGRRKVQPGEFVDSRVSEIPARLNVQVYDKGERPVTIVVVDPDVPDVKNDSFTSRCHFLAVNVPISPTLTSVPLARLSKDSHIIQPWLPPYAQRGSPYHRLVVFILQQDGTQPLDLAQLRQYQSRREGWKLKGLLTKNNGLRPIGVNIFRTVWDEGTDGVMKRAGVEGAEIEYIRKKPEKNVYKKKDGARYR